jgi:hypothetical protein
VSEVVALQSVLSLVVLGALGSSESRSKQASLSISLNSCAQLQTCNKGKKYFLQELPSFVQLATLYARARNEQVSNQQPERTRRW